MDIRLQQFTGPLDLLLSLIEDQELDISQVSLATVTEQFLRHLESLPEEHAEELADFLVMATRLLLLKSRTMLPLAVDDSENGQSLEEQLRLYREFVKAARSLNKRWLSNDRSVFRVEPLRKAEGFVWPEIVSLDLMRKIMSDIIYRLQPPKPLLQTKIDATVSMKEKISHIRQLLERGKSIHFFDIIENSQNKTELIVCFLAILELVKQRDVLLHQEDSFQNILIQPVSSLV